MASSAKMSQRRVATCDIHEKLMDHCCIQCKIVECQECLVKNHLGHNISVYDDDMHSAITIQKDLQAEIKNIIEVVKDTIETINTTSNINITANAMEVGEEIRANSQRFVTALENREEELLSEINHIKQRQIQLVPHQVKELNSVLSELTMCTQLLTVSLDSNDPNKIASANERAEEYLGKFSKIEENLEPVLAISFVPSPSLMDDLRSAGSIVAGRTDD